MNLQDKESTMKRKNKVKTVIFFVIFMMIGFEQIYSQNMYVFAEEADIHISYEEYMKSNIPDGVTEYFNTIFEQTISVYMETMNPNEQNIGHDLSIGSTFVIHKIDGGETDIWYIPIYENDKILCIYCIGYAEDYFCTITAEYTEELNNMHYNHEDILFQTANGIYAINRNNVITVLSGDNIEEEYENIEYEQIYSKVMFAKPMNNSSNSNILRYKMQKSSRSNSLSSDGVVNRLEYGAICNMNHCFVKQYNYDLCWAASAATIIRYRTNNATVNAFDIALLCNKPYRDDKGIEHYTGTMDDVQFALCYYGVYYSVFERKLSMAEIRREIIHGNPIYMMAYVKDNWGNVYGHGTVLYGYSEIFNMGLLYMWNPRTEQGELVFYPKSGDVTYLYQNLQYKWVGTVCNRLYVTK